MSDRALGEGALSLSKGLDFRPAPGAAPAARRILRHTRVEALLLVRNGEQLLLALVIPIAVLVIGRLLEARVGSFQALAPSVLALAIWSSGFTSVAIATGFERRYGVLERLAATPLGRGGLLLGKALAIVMVILGQLVALSLIGLALGWRPSFTIGSALEAIAAIVLAIGAFVSLALLLAGWLRAEATLALANVIYVVLLAGGGLVLSVARYPLVLRGVIELLPTGALGEALRSGSAGVTLWWPLPVLLVWFAVAALAARKVFRWLS